MSGWAYHYVLVRLHCLVRCVMRERGHIFLPSLSSLESSEERHCFPPFPSLRFNNFHSFHHLPKNSPKKKKKKNVGATKTQLRFQIGIEIQKLEIRIGIVGIVGVRGKCGLWGGSSATELARPRRPTTTAQDSAAAARVREKVAVAASAEGGGRQGYFGKCSFQEDRRCQACECEKVSQIYVIRPGRSWEQQD